jgi:hypothetical protein
MSTGICFLVINKVKELPELAILSVMKQTEKPIFVGYIHQEDILALPKAKQITYVKLEIEGFEITDTYQDFGSIQFYKAVIRKWMLFQKILDLGFENVIYSDLDLVWVRDASVEIENYFQKQEVEIAVQSITQSPAHPSLCMGFFAFRNTPFVREFIEKCLYLHQAYLDEGSFLGDDEVITEMYIKNEYDERIRELPQTTFPVGQSINLFKGRSVIPGMATISPYVFHANYVIGIRKKRILLRKFLGKKELRALGFSPDPGLWCAYAFDLMVHFLKRLFRPLKSSLLKVYARSH